MVSLRTRPQLGETSPITRDQEVPTRTLTYLTSQSHGRQNTTKVDADRREVVFFFFAVGVGRRSVYTKKNAVDRNEKV